MRATFVALMVAGAVAALAGPDVSAQAGGQVQRFEEKPLVKDYWINAGFFVFEKQALLEWKGHNLEQDVLPDFARRGRLFVNTHIGFWKSMDTSKDQQELEKLCAGGLPPWIHPSARTGEGA